MSSEPPPSEPMSSGPVFSRRRLMVGAGAVGAAGLIAAGTATHPWTALAASGPGPAPVIAGRGKLVLVTLYGGNDGLNTVVPYTDSAYHAGRPTLGYQPGEVLPLDAELGLSPKLTGFKSLWQAKKLAVVLGVGYPDPSLSHFQSMDIWQTANPDAEGSGWLGRWLDATGTDPLRAISVGSALPTALRGQRTAATAITSSAITLPGSTAYQDDYGRLAAPGPDRVGLAAQVASTGLDLLSVKSDLDRLHVDGSTAPGASTSTGQPATSKTGGARTSFGDQLAMVGSLIKAGAPTQVYQVSLSSFDTHADEKTTQETLLAELDAGVSSFFAALEHVPDASDVVLMTYSEFGRRVAQNASGGTDHGTASPLFVVGPGVKGGRFYGEQPSLTNLDDGDLRFNVDFRSVYATMLDRVIGVDPKSFLGASYPTLALV